MITSRPEEFVSVRDNIVETIEQRITNNNIILVAYYTDDVHNKRLAAVAYYYIRQHIYTRITMRILRIHTLYTYKNKKDFIAFATRPYILSSAYTCCSGCNFSRTHNMHKNVMKI